MTLSVVIPAYNEEKRLPEHLASLEREIARSGCVVEVIVVNNASTDRTAEIARSYPWVRVVDEPKKGMVRARQAGFLVAKGDLIANLDADTIVPEGWIDTVLSAFVHDVRLVALSGPYIYYDLSWIHRALTRLWYYIGYISHLINQYVLHVGAMVQGGNFILRRSALEQIGGFDTSIEFYGEDTDIARRMSKVGKVTFTFALPMYTTGRRLKEEGTLRTALKYASNYVSTTFLGRPVTYVYTDIREKT